MPYKFLAFFFLVLIYSSVVFLCTCSRNFIYECIRGKDSAIMRIGNFNIY